MPTFNRRKSLGEIIEFIKGGYINEFKVYLQPYQVNQIHNTYTKWRPIHYCCGYGQLEMVKYLVKNKCDINVLAMDKCHSLHIAARYGYEDIVKYLISKKCCIELQNNIMERPIHLACDYGHNNVVQVLLDNNCEINAKSLSDWTPLHRAARFGNIQTITLLLSHGAKVDAITLEGFTPDVLAKKYNKFISGFIFDLHKSKVAENEVIPMNATNVKDKLHKVFIAIKQGDVDCFRANYDKEYIIEKNSESGICVLDLLHNMEAWDMLEIALDDFIEDAVLLQTQLYEEHKDKLLHHYHVYRAIRERDYRCWYMYSNVQTINEICVMTKESFLTISAKFGDTGLTLLILEMTIMIDESYARAKEVASSYKFDEIVTLIEKREKFIQSRRLVNWSRLHVAVYDNREDVIKYILCSQMAEASIIDSNSNTPLNIAIMLGHNECAKLLLKHENNINRRNKFGQTILHLAIEGSMEELVKDILDLRTDLAIKDLLGVNPLSASIIRGQKATCNKILSKRKHQMSEPIVFHKLALETLEKPWLHKRLYLTMKESYFTLCMKVNGELFDSLINCINMQVLNMRDGNGSTLLHISIEIFNLNLISTIINIGKQKVVDVKDKEGNTSWHLFIKRCVTVDKEEHKEGIEDIVRRFISTGADMLTKNNVGESLMSACFDLNDEKIFQMIFFEVGSARLTAEDVCIIINKDWFSTLDFFMSNVISSFPTSCFNELNIMKIFEKCSPESIKLILSSSAAGLIKEKREELLMIAVDRELNDIFHLILKEGGTSLKRLPDGETLMTSLLKKEKYGYCKVLLSHAKDFVSTGDGFIIVDERNLSGQTALCIAANGHDMEMFESVLLESAQWNNVDNDGNSVLGIFIKNVGQLSDVNKIKEAEKMIKIMIRGGQDLFKIEGNGRTVISGCDNTELRTKLERFQTSVRPDRRSEDSVGGDAVKNICQICLHNEINRVLQCGHPFCQECLRQLDICPSCRHPIEKQLSLYL